LRLHPKFIAGSSLSGLLGAKSLETGRTGFLRASVEIPLS
jgi:hypothetical protein